MPNIIMSAAIGSFSKGLKNEFETAVVNEPSVFEPLKFYCMLFEQDIMLSERHIKLFGQDIKLLL